MTDRPTLNLSDLEAKARAAQEEAPGPWRVDLLGSDGVDGVYGTVPVGDDDRPPKIIETDSGFYPPSLPVAAHIAAASPDVVLELVARVRELERELERWRHGSPEADEPGAPAEGRGETEEGVMVTTDELPPCVECGDEAGLTLGGDRLCRDCWHRAMLERLARREQAARARRRTEKSSRE